MRAWLGLESGLGLGSPTTLQDGDIVNVDVSPILNGVHSDLNETFCVGNVNTKTKSLVKAAHDSLWAAIDMCKPGKQRTVGVVSSGY